MEFVLNSKTDNTITLNGNHSVGIQKMDDFNMDAGDECGLDGEKGSGSKQITESKRMSRNMNEKKRRDRFNVLIGELSAIISPSSRKIDKTTVLKKAISCLKSQKDISPASCSKPREGWQPPFVSDPELCQLIVESMDGFVIDVDSNGVICFVSDNVTSQLGYLTEKIVHTQLVDYLETRDKDLINARLQNLKLQEREIALYRAPEKTAKATAISDMVELDLSFIYGPVLEASGFAMLHCISQAYIMESSNYVPGGKPAGGTPERKVHLVLLCCLETLCPAKVMSLANTSNSEFTARLTLDWKFTHVDQRALSVIGYLPNELIDTSIYRYIHVSDLENISRYHKTLVYKGRVTTCYYRYLTKGHTWIWLRSCCYISYNQWNSRPEYIIATTTMASQREVTANQENTLKQDEVQFKNLEKKQLRLPSNGTSDPAPSCSTESLASYTESTVASYPALSSSFGISVPVIEHASKASVMSPMTLPSSDGDVPPSPVMEGGSANKINRLMSSGASVCQVLDSLVQTDISDAGFGSEEEESNHEKTPDTSSPWNLPLPEGLSATQYKLHEQLKDKHIMLENSIKRQIRDLGKIKKQIEINKDLWDFNKKVQKYRGSSLNGSLDGSKSIPTSRVGPSSIPVDLSNLNLLPQDKQLQSFMEDLPTVDYTSSSAASVSLPNDFFPVPVPSRSLPYTSEDMDSSYSQSSSSTMTSNPMAQYPFYSFDPQTSR